MCSRLNTGSVMTEKLLTAPSLHSALGNSIQDIRVDLFTKQQYTSGLLRASNVCVSMSLNCEHGRGGMDTVFSISVFIGLSVRPGT